MPESREESIEYWEGYPFGDDIIIHVWDDSPDAGDRECLCSLCLNRIYEGEFPIRLFGWNFYSDGSKRSTEVRFHPACFRIADAILRGESLIWGKGNFDEVLQGVTKCSAG